MSTTKPVNLFCPIESQEPSECRTCRKPMGPGGRLAWPVPGLLRLQPAKADVIRSLAGRFPAFPNRFIDSLPTTHAHIRHSPDRHQLQHASGADSGRCLPHPARPWIEHSVTATPRWECGIRDAECGMRGDVTPPRLEASELRSLHRNTEILGCSCSCC